MNPQQILERIRLASAALSARQLVTLALAFGAVVALTIGSAYWINTPNYSVLFSDMDPESAGAVVTKLKASKVPYQVEDGGRTVKVPASQLDELRLDLASQGMPSSGRIGFEIFDRTAFGVTDFLEHVNYRRALEGELARTISTIGEVAGARVHIAIPQPSVFTSQQQPTTASVVLKLRNNRPLAASTVNAITGLVASAVESLKPESVVIIDNYGRPLAKSVNASEEATSGQQVERQQRLEQDLSTRVVALLEPIVGPGRVRVNVSAKINSESAEETEERWDPASVVRSKQSVNQSGTGIMAAQGVAGAKANLPPDESGKETTPPPVASVSPGPSSLQTAETTNYEVGRLTRHTIQPRGDIGRLSVAVVLDDDREAAPAGTTGEGARKPRSTAEIEKIHDLVAAAVGFDEDRGDQLTVENIAFEETPLEVAAPQTIWQQYQAPALEIGRILGGVLIFALVIMGFVRPLVTGSLAGAPALTAGTAVASAAAPGLPRTVQDLETQIDAQLQLEADQQAGQRRLPALTKRVATLTQREPENAARLLRTWLTEDDR